ncbi:hypothetical protein EYF80_052814 [Liparis tanakae]|uniref:Uncharacterized protein n=1 Tax=Liparis tanakae TaxID=230148 RepID=A0A4Z2F6Z5_9TELE|nr:hypothetical protein EYF80_052814 [Liparis tanakae]
MVVFRYLWCPARSMKVIILEELSQISSAVRDSLISKLMLEVRPVWISCRCLKRLSLARPRPLSSSPCVSTPSRVDFPESTLPSTATRRSRNCPSPEEHMTEESGRYVTDVVTAARQGRPERGLHVGLRQADQQAVVLHSDLVDGLAAALLQAPLQLRGQMLEAILRRVDQLQLHGETRREGG